MDGASRAKLIPPFHSESICRMFYPTRPSLRSISFVICLGMCIAGLSTLSGVRQSSAFSPTNTPTATASRTPSQTYTPGGPSLTPTRTLVLSSTPSVPSATPTVTYTPGGPSLTPTSSSTSTSAFTSYLALSYASVSPTEKLDIYVPPGSGPFPLILYIHGGGWVSGTRHVDQSYVYMQVVSHGYALASLDYRLSGEAIFPAQIYDVKAAIRWLRANAATYKFDPNRIGLWGYSSGGHLADLAGTSGGVSSLEDVTMGNANVSSRVQAVVSWAGPTKLLAMDNEKLACDTYDFDAPDSPVTYLLGAQPQTHPTLANNASPISYVSNDDPPFLLQQGTLDCTVPPLQSQDLYEALTAANVPVTLRWMIGGGHSSFTSDPTVTAQVITFFDKYLKNLGNPSATPSPSPTPTATPSTRTDSIGVYAGGVFYLRNSNTTGMVDIVAVFGSQIAGGTVNQIYPVTGDWNGDGVDTIGVYDTRFGTFYLRDSNTAGPAQYQFTMGSPGDHPLAGHWDNTMLGDGVGVYRPSNGLLYAKRSLATGYADFTMVLGIPGDSGIAGDWDGSGYDSIGVWRPSTTTWYLSDTLVVGGFPKPVYANRYFQFGPANLIPFAGHWGGTSGSQVGFMRNGTAYLLTAMPANGTAVSGLNFGANLTFAFGPPGALPVAGRWTASGGAPSVSLMMPRPTIIGAATQTLLPTFSATPPSSFDG